jgi:hypothetical protein
LWRPQGKWLTDTVVFHSVVIRRKRPHASESLHFQSEMPLPLLVPVSQIVAERLTMRGGASHPMRQ